MSGTQKDESRASQTSQSSQAQKKNETPQGAVMTDELAKSIFQDMILKPDLPDPSKANSGSQVIVYLAIGIVIVIILGFLAYYFLLRDNPSGQQAAGGQQAPGPPGGPGVDANGQAAQGNGQGSQGNGQPQGNGQSGLKEGGGSVTPGAQGNGGVQGGVQGNGGNQGNGTPQGSGGPSGPQTMTGGGVPIQLPPGISQFAPSASGPLGTSTTTSASPPPIPHGRPVIQAKS